MTQTRGSSAPTAGLVYVVDDEAAICQLLAETLTQFGFRTESFARAEDMLKALDRQVPEACLIDLGLPDMEGMVLINEIRRRTFVPILVLSARSHSSDRVMGLELGADDYVVKPFDPREVVARLRSVLRRAADRPKPADAVRVARFSGHIFDPSSHRLVGPAGDESFLSTGEATLLEALLKAPKRVLSRDYLLEHGGRDESLDRSIDVRVSRLRKKLAGEGGTPLIRTIYGSGYMLTSSVDWS